VYEDAEGRWRWRAIARNSRVVGAAEQGYASKYYASTKAKQYAEVLGCEVVVIQSTDEA
jgi:hypothetical protein